MNYAEKFGFKGTKADNMEYPSITYKQNDKKLNIDFSGKQDYIKNINGLVENRKIRWLRKKLQMQGAQILRNEAYFLYAAVMKDAAQHSR